VLPIPDLLRGPWKDGDPGAGEGYGQHARAAVERARERGRSIAAVIMEPVAAVPGMLVFPEGYLAAVYRHTREAGGLCIADEVQCGFGRVGTHFWGFQTQGVVPDIVTVGKPMGNGFPMAALFTTREIANKFSNGMEFYSTFGGNPVACAVGLEVLHIIRDDGLQAHALKVGSLMLSLLKDLQQKYPAVIGHVRGTGLFLGMEMVKPGEAKEPNEELACGVASRLRDRNILLTTEGPKNHVLKLKPPMHFSEENCRTVHKAIDEILKDMILV
jgi:4-aminobutyrate aminotransferase-like enzyme